MIDWDKAIEAGMASPQIPLFRADWLSPVFIHFAVDASRLQTLVPFELDFWDGRAMLSLVAFTQARLQPVVGGRIGAWLSAPLARHEFLNLRTYVRVGEDRGIFFLSEWIPNRLAVLLGPLMYGLPYQLGRLRYSSDPETGELHGVVKRGSSSLIYRGRILPHQTFQPARPGTRDQFLVERYVAFTSRAAVHRSFRVSHEPWPIRSISIDLPDKSLLGPFESRLGQRLVPVAAHHSPGVRDVLLSRPYRLAEPRNTDFAPAIG